MGAHLLPALQARWGVLQHTSTLISQTPACHGGKNPCARLTLPPLKAHLPSGWWTGVHFPEFWGPGVLVSPPRPAPLPPASRHYHFSMMWLM